MLKDCPDLNKVKTQLLENGYTEEWLFFHFQFFFRLQIASLFEMVQMIVISPSGWF